MVYATSITLRLHHLIHTSHDSKCTNCIKACDSTKYKERIFQMIEFILPYVQDKDARAIPSYQTYLKEQKNYILDRYRRFQHQLGYASPGINLLRYILQFIDLDYLNNQSNNYDRYTYHIRFIYKDIIEIFDKSKRGDSYTNLFFNQTNEYLLPVSDINAIINLPLYTNDWNTWKLVKPLRVWCTDSDEFTINILNDKVIYNGEQPSYAIELLDPVALIFKYYIWLTNQKQFEPNQELVDETPALYFLHKYVMCDSVWDLGDNWLLRQLNHVLRFDNLTDFYQNLNSTPANRQYGWISLRFVRAMNEIWNLTHDIKRNIRPEAFFSSKLLFSGSINNRIGEVSNDLTLPHLLQYEWMTFIRDKDLMKLFIKVWSFRKDLPSVKSMGINLRRDLRRMLLRRPWAQCVDPKFKLNMENEMRAMVEEADVL